jgi:GT2 family glycosyltransferase
MNSRPNDPLVTIVTRSPGLDAGAIEAVVTLPTFRRPQQVLATLRSLANQRTARRFAVIVMENETDLREGAAAAAPLFQSGEMNGLVIIAHQRGNCAAYNAGWSTALMYFPSFRHLLVIDDDEIADPDWLENMCQAAERLPADIVGGPQIPVFEAADTQRLQGHPVFLPPYRETGLKAALYSSGNLLLSRKVLEAMPQPFLDLRFNFMGGGDSDFLSRAAARGFALGWCNEGVIREDIPARRTEWDWVRARALRNGVISTLVENNKRAAQPLGRLIVIGRSLVLLATSPFRMVMRLVGGEPLSSAAYPIHVALGRIGAEFGYANEQYREPEKN